MPSIFSRITLHLFGVTLHDLKQTVLVSCGFLLSCGGRYARYDTIYVGKQTLIDRMMLAYLMKRFYAADEATQRRMNTEMFWGSKIGDGWHGSMPEDSPYKVRFRKFVVANFKSLSVNSIIEFGSGNGFNLDFMKREFPPVDRYVGVDLSPTQIATSKVKWGENSFEFYAGDAIEWLEQNKPNGALLVAAGTLEYLTLIQVRKFFDYAKANNCTIALQEPVSEPPGSRYESKPRNLGAFSHNYSALGLVANLKIVAEELENPRPGVWLISLILSS